MPRTWRNLKLGEIKEGLLAIPESTLNSDGWLKGFVKSIVSRIVQYGNLTPGQAEAAVKQIVKFAPREFVAKLDLVADGVTPTGSGSQVFFRKIDRPDFTVSEAFSSVEYLPNVKDREDIEDYICKLVEDKSDKSRELLKVFLKAYTNDFRNTATDNDKLKFGFIERVGFIPTGNNSQQTGQVYQQKSPDQKLIHAFTLITPFFSGDKEYYSKFNVAGRYSLSPRQKEVVLFYLNNYQYQLPSEVQVSVHNQLDEPSQFYKFYTLKYIKFLAEVAKFASATGLMRADKSVDEFIKTDGLGGTYQTDVFREVKSAITKWERVVDHVKDKLLKSCDNVTDARLLAIKEYLLNPELFNDTIKDDESAKLIVDEFTTVFTDEAKQAALECMQILAGVCDYAHTRDDQGFNKAHTQLGHRLAVQSEISDKEMPFVLSMCRLYRKQLPDRLLRKTGILGGKSVSDRVRVEKPDNNSVNSQINIPVQVHNAVAKYLFAITFESR